MSLMEPKLTKDEKKALRQEEWKKDLEKERKKQLMGKVWLWGFGALLVVMALGGLVAFSNGQSTSQSSSSSISIPPVTTKDYISTVSSGSSALSGKVATLVEYADFQCPACKAYYPLVKQLQQDEGSKLHLVYRYFPLSSVHQNAVASAQAAYAAGLQGKFWQMHDLLFENQDSWATLADPSSTFISYAKSLQLNTTQFQKDYASDTTAKIINDAYTNDVGMGLNSTPTFFLNGKQITNPNSYADFKKLIDVSIK